jgi:alpha-L-fucosidase
MMTECGRSHPIPSRPIPNGEGIYATRPRDGSLWSESETVPYTRTKDRRSVYAFTLLWPGKELLLTAVKPRAGSEIRMLGYPDPLRWSYDPARGLAISLPDNLQDEAHRPCQYAWAYKIETENG